MNIRKNKGLTLLGLVITVIIIIIIAGVSISAGMLDHRKTEDQTLMVELEMIQQAILTRYTKSKLVSDNLPGTAFMNFESLSDAISGMNIVLKGNEISDYKRLNENNLKSLGITPKTNDIYIVNYTTGEVINETQRFTSSGVPLYVYSKSQ